MSISTALAQSAEIIGARIHGPVTQRDFLRRLGIEKRAATLKARALPDKAAEIDQCARAAHRSGARTAWANCSRSLAIADPKLGALPGFEACKR